MGFLTSTAATGEVYLALDFEDVALCIVPRSLFLLTIVAKWVLCFPRLPTEKISKARCRFWGVAAVERKVRSSSSSSHSQLGTLTVGLGGSSCNHSHPPDIAGPVCERGWKNVDSQGPGNSGGLHLAVCLCSRPLGAVLEYTKTLPFLGAMFPRVYSV